MTPADLQIPERGSAPVEDPAVVAAKEAEAAKAAWFAIPVNTPADEKAPEYKAAEKRSKEADEAFSAAPVTSLAGALVKLRALQKDITEDEGVSWGAQHVRTVTAFLEGLTGAPSVVDDNHPDAALLALWEEWVPLMDRLNDPRTSEDEADALSEKTWEIERRIIDTTPQTPVGLMVPVKLLARYQEIGPEFTDHRERDLGRNILAALERLTPGLVEIEPVATPDPAVVAFAELKAANAAFKVISEKETDDPGPESPEYVAAYERFGAAREAVYDVVPVSMAGVAAKVRGMLEHQSDAYELGPDFNIMAKSMLPFLEGAPAPTPKPDPVVVLFAGWRAIQDKVKALADTDPKAENDEVGKQLEKMFDDQFEIEECIAGMNATSAAGIAIKLRLMVHIQFPKKGITDLHRTPAKDMNLAALIAEWRDHDDVYQEDHLLIGALRDAERLAGVS